MSDYIVNTPLRMKGYFAGFSTGEIVYVTSYNFDDTAYQRPGNIVVNTSPDEHHGNWVPFDMVERVMPEVLKFGLTPEETNNFIKDVMESSNDHAYCPTTRDVLESAGLPRGYIKKTTYTLVIEGSDEFNTLNYLRGLINSSRGNIFVVSAVETSDVKE